MVGAPEAGATGVAQNGLGRWPASPLGRLCKTHKTETGESALRIKRCGWGRAVVSKGVAGDVQ
jgi:hypothetical protein